MPRHTPLIQQYLDIKARHADSILFFRVGDFYEMFFEDAHEGSRLLGVALTSRNNGPSDVPLAGIPAKALNEYLPRLVRSGRRVAICEQVEDAASAEGIVRREVVEIVTPGTVLDEALLTEGRNNFVTALAGDGPVGLATVDLSTGEFDVWDCEAGAVADELERIEPAEVLVAEGRGTTPRGGWTVTKREDWRFEPDLAAETLSHLYGVATLEGFGFAPDVDGHLAGAAGAVAAYLEEVRPGGLAHLREPRVHRAGRFLYLDEMTRRNLELVEPLRPGGGTLLGVLDRTLTPMGRRMLRRRLLRPLVRAEEIEARLDAVAELVDDGRRRRRVREALEKVGDLERLAGRLATGRIGPRGLLSIGASLAALPDLAGALEGVTATALRGAGGLDALTDVRERIERAIAPDAPASLATGGVIRAGHSEALDRLREIRDGAVDWIARLQESERGRTGIESLKIGFNRVFGYYIEVTRANLGRVPEDYERRQTLTNAERYVTPELKEWERKVAEAEEEIASREADLFAALREELSSEVRRIQETAVRVAEIDVVAGLAETADRAGYARPEITHDFGLDIERGRHPVVERTIAREDFIPNDVRLDRDMFAMVLTGPNMAGKSTLLRQVGLTVLMAQTGSFVPADRARIGLADRIFTRVGASDDLARGQSTFMVEMTETATILNGATDRSLILLDEIGRGTSTYDGVAIAWAVTEYIHEHLGARTIFATHYHELVELADRLDGVGAWNVAVRETGEDIVFLRRLEPGGCDRSYGVHVARLAGIPRTVTERAMAVLHELEAGPAGGGSRLARMADRERGQLSLFEAREAGLAGRLRDLDPDRTTPLEALALLAELKRLASDG
ncbi:MAG: DNA mismatch repair protein MutS [Gemmatimonadota bacterium]